MQARVVDIGCPASIRAKWKLLVVEPQDGEEQSVPLEDLGVLILDDPHIRISKHALGLLAESNVATVVCDDKHMPVGLLLPLEGNALHTQILRRQIEVKLPRKKRAWQAIVQAKIRNQAEVVRRTGGRAGKLLRLANEVRSGDPENLEGIAAGMYFKALCGDEFVRERGVGGINALLNYGYAVLRAACARALVGAGLHPALGIHHMHRNNPFCLADDVMEPVRPLVDWVALEVGQDLEDDAELTPALKRHMLGLTLRQLKVGRKRYPFTVGLGMYSAAFREYLLGEARKLEIPVPDLDVAESAEEAEE